MMVKLERISSGADSTIGALFLDGVFLCFTCEDQFRPLGQKVAGETRIPAGRYPLKLRRRGGFHKRYARKFGSMHRGMIEVCDVPGFTDILIHVGNTEKHTAGCILVGRGALRHPAGGGTVQHSVDAYRYAYPRILGPLTAGEDVFLTILDRDLK